jgi:hypothetical protein
MIQLKPFGAILSHIFLQTIRGTYLRNKYVIKNNDTPQGEGEDEILYQKHGYCL